MSFRFDGARYTGFAGDTLASALLATGVTLVGRSFKYHRPRGILTAGSEEPNALVELRTGARREPNTRATVAELFDGLEARARTAGRRSRFDLGAINSLFVAALRRPASTTRPSCGRRRSGRSSTSPLIRRAAGLGRASRAADPDTYEKAYAFCDVLVIGGGPARACRGARRRRARARASFSATRIFVLGGRLNGERHEIDGRPRHGLGASQSQPNCARFPNVRIMRAHDGVRRL